MDQEISFARAINDGSFPRLATLSFSSDSLRKLLFHKKGIERETGARVSVSDGTVTIVAKTQPIIDKALEKVEFLVGHEIEVGKTYKGTVSSIKEYGAFVEFNGGQHGLLHISELSHEPVSKVSDVVSVGQMLSFMKDLASKDVDCLPSQGVVGWTAVENMPSKNADVEPSIDTPACSTPPVIIRSAAGCVAQDGHTKKRSKVANSSPEKHSKVATNRCISMSAMIPMKVTQLKLVNDVTHMKDIPKSYGNISNVVIGIDVPIPPKVPQLHFVEDISQKLVGSTANAGFGSDTLIPVKMPQPQLVKDMGITVQMVTTKPASIVTSASNDATVPISWRVPWVKLVKDVTPQMFTSRSGSVAVKIDYRAAVAIPQKMPQLKLVKDITPLATASSRHQIQSSPLLFLALLPPQLVIGDGDGAVRKLVTPWGKLGSVEAIGAKPSCAETSAMACFKSVMACINYADGAVFDLMVAEGVKPNIVTYNALLSAYASRDLHSRRRLGRCSFNKYSVGCVWSLQAGIKSYLSLGDYEKALELYTSMRISNVKPDAVTYNILISGSCKLGKYVESLGFFEDMMDSKVSLTKEVYSSLIYSYVKQGKLSEAESTFDSMKKSGCFPDVLTYTTMIQAYNADGSWTRAWDLFKEMEGNSIQPDAIICSSLMEAFNKGGQPERVIQLMEFMKEKCIPLNQKAYFEIIASCTTLRDWNTTSEMIEYLDSSLSSISVGTLNHILDFLGKCGKTENMMKMFYKMVTSCSTVGLSTYTVLLRNLLAVGKWRKYIEVLQWMEDAGVRPTLFMYQNVLPYIWRENGMDYATLMEEKISSLREENMSS
ncbi:hypothetical protein GUJ93_ZPchr0013g35686 [Zizania palustris]|uniref:S1 motif domain-containing protein n=1 Tax=Zizania palustris TaxID=103762 RepID=A0A8J5X1U7_ZIZPA|nr:hypothetical protein GUJ93_ZPchr0013g35686 [Zizania palustris]